MFNNINEIIEFLETYNRVEWAKSKKIIDENGETTTIMGHPVYDEKVTEIIKYIHSKYKIEDEEYVKFVQEKWYDWEIKDLTEIQLAYKIFFIYQSERFADGIIGKNIEDGTLLEIFKLIQNKKG